MRSYISNEALGLDVGESSMVYCPVCDNAPPYKPSLSITRLTEGILFNCFRAVCGTHGFVPSMPSDLIKVAKQKEHKFKQKVFTHPTIDLDDDWLEWLHTTYGIEPEEVAANQIKLTLHTKGLVMPLFNVQGYQYGCTTKYFDEQTKAVHYLETETSKLAFINPRKHGTTVILVEDMLSAIRVHRFHQGVALLGTHLNAQQVQDLLKAGHKRVIMALDPDAIAKAVKLRQMYGLFFDEFVIRSLSDDPKNLSHEKLKEELEI